MKKSPNKTGSYHELMQQMHLKMQYQQRLNLASFFHEQIHYLAHDKQFVNLDQSTSWRRLLVHHYTDWIFLLT